MNFICVFIPKQCEQCGYDIDKDEIAVIDIIKVVIDQKSGKTIDEIGFFCNSECWEDYFRTRD